MRLGILGTGAVGKTLAARLSGMGHEVMIGTRDADETMSRTDPDQLGNPPFSAWRREHPEVELGTFDEAAAHGEMVVNATACGLPGGARSGRRGEPEWQGPRRRIEPAGLLEGCPLRCRCRTPTRWASKYKGGSSRLRWSRPCKP